MATSTQQNAPLTIDLPLAMVKRLEEEAKKRGLDRTTLLLKVAHDAIVDPPKIPDQDHNKQVSFRVSPVLRKKLAEQARKNDISVGQLIRESLKRWMETGPF